MPAAWAEPARESLERSLTAAHRARELAFLEKRPGFERPYGLAWLLQLGAELRAWDHAPARRWSEALAPLEELAAKRVIEWAERLPWPVRSGEHSQSAFALGLMLDYARSKPDDPFAKLVSDSARKFFLADKNGPLSYEPSGEDFLSPCLLRQMSCAVFFRRLNSRSG